jgi:hypothetical protein
MPKLLDVMFLKHCPHEFSWPRRLESGECYQVCLLCGDQYGYDWKKMCRLDRIASPVAVSERRLQAKAKWLPRARRHHISIPIRYKKPGNPGWHDGEIQNISESGVFVAGAEMLPEKCRLEMAFEMPVQISGKQESPVLCSGKVSRMNTKHPDGRQLFAVSIMTCEYLHEDTPISPSSSKKIGGMAAAAALLKAVRCRSRGRV